MSLLPKLPLCSHRYALFVSYLGSRYNGSQRLVARGSSGIQDTIQEALEWSLESFLPLKRCRITASSRTDKGVHALNNCYTLPLMDDTIPTEKLKRLANDNLISKCHEILVNEVILVPAVFHPRKDAVSREYIYRIAVFDSQRSRFLGKDQCFKELLHLLPVNELYRLLPLPYFDVDRAEKALDLFRGEHDFTSFAFKPGDDEITVRTLEASLAQVEPGGIDPGRPHPYTLYQLHFKSKSFLHNQIRRITGAVISYATYSSIDLDCIKRMLENPNSANWPAEMIIAQPCGLFLRRINYAKSTFAGSIRTYEDKTREEIDNFLAFDELSDDNVEQSKTLEVECDKPAVIFSAPNISY